MKIKLYCPNCNGRVADTEDTVITKTKAIYDDQTISNDNRKPDYYVKCSKCKSNIGIWKIK